MAQRDHSLDDKITAAAMEEFSDKGYTGASLRRIAEKAGVTVGAIQTRYRSKDELFTGLLKPLLVDIDALFQYAEADYYAGDGLPESLKGSMQREADAILHLIFAHYREAVLLLCRSSGSSMEHFFDGIVQRKINESIAFFHNAGFADIEEKLFGLLIAAQFDGYRRIVTECSDRKTAEKYMGSLMIYHFGGWSAFFDSVDQSKEVTSDEV